MTGSDIQLKYSYGQLALSDHDAAVGKLVKWNARTKKAKLRLYNGRIISRRASCIFVRTSGRVVCEFRRGYLLCKVRQFPIVGNPENPRNGFLLTTTWHRTYATGYQQQHIGGGSNTELYAIVVDDKLVYRPYAYLEVSNAVTDVAGDVQQGLCTLDS